MGRIDFLRVMTKKESKKARREDLAWLKKAMEGGFGVNVANHVSRFVYTIKRVFEEIASNWDEGS